MRTRILPALLFAACAAPPRQPPSAPAPASTMRAHVIDVGRGLSVLDRDTAVEAPIAGAFAYAQRSVEPRDPEHEENLHARIMVHT